MNSFQLINSESGPGRFTALADSYGGRFETVRFLAGHGQGYAVLVRDTWCDSLTVLKGMWLPDPVKTDPRQARSELARTAAELREGVHASLQTSQLTQHSPAIVNVVEEPSPALQALGHIDRERESFVVQEYVGSEDAGSTTLGGLIADYAARGAQFSTVELLDVAEQLCDALAAMHTPRYREDDGGASVSTSWVHADVKPDNVLVLETPRRYVLIDYDAAKRSGDRIVVSTDPYAPVQRYAGSPPPERDAADQRFDVYMLGATLAHAAGLRPLDDNQRWALYWGDPRQAESAVTELADLGYGPIITHVIRSCLARQEYRLANVGIVRAELRKARDSHTMFAALQARRSR
ncbi:hypothetical protein GCM10027570_25210 [Streptomonospora sediminis]